MDTTGDTEKKKEKYVAGNGSEFDILRKDEIFWQKTVKNLAIEEISETKLQDETSENVSK